MIKRILGLGVALVAITACDSATSKDPETLSKDALNPPSGLVTVTGDQQIELRWQAMNAEEDFKGFRVFAVAKKISDLKAPGYPTSYTLEKLSSGSVPRCDKNSELFEAFGFPAIPIGDKACEGDASSDNSASGPAKSFGLVADEADTSATNPDAVPPQVVKCYDSTGKDLSSPQLSLPATTPALNEQSCVVKTLADGTSLLNGTTYTFFVTAINANETFDSVQISWTSNFVEDTPATVLFDDAVELKVGKIKYIPIEKLQSKKAFDTLSEADCGEAPAAGCSIYKLNDREEIGIYFGRIGSGNYPQRTFISTNSGNDLAILLRGPQTYDPLRGEDTIASSIPKDQASTATYSDDGAPQPIYGNQVFDYTVVIDNQKHYGKVVIEQVTLAVRTNAASTITFRIKVLLQPAPNNPHYLR